MKLDGVYLENLVYILYVLVIYVLCILNYVNNFRYLKKK